ncbi:MAG: hypothetical protein CLLPBCKN_001154 [Chroococcidiopsis cubana SAG 39.79]|jgi:hypothetical protein|nr:hypothetical protein [Chroococcidiopsis cubana SAG 39.79]
MSLQFKVNKFVGAGFYQIPQTPSEILDKPARTKDKLRIFD